MSPQATQYLTIGTRQLVGQLDQKQDVFMCRKFWLGCLTQQLWVHEGVPREEVSGREELSLKYPLLSPWLATYGCQPGSRVWPLALKVKGYN